ncbi:leucine-rich repeat-containing G- coupled receptor 6 [Xyrichtys novacula]|uniref:Leucine-rich repeat-containing G- coupled receptor 6 n=1 Tax=Xyrichtys novacula TaxID=13765 RepID=A0AAV1FFS9_XYRNO|nr:leucine-rich repeat-containing G- coupled receptor 6 [Xyrichtys novacula]
MKKAFNIMLYGLFPNSIHVTCLAHLLNLVPQVLPDTFEDRVCAIVKRVFCKAPQLHQELQAYMQVWQVAAAPPLKWHQLHPISSAAEATDRGSPLLGALCEALLLPTTWSPAGHKDGFPRPPAPAVRDLKELLEEKEATLKAQAIFIVEHSTEIKTTITKLENLLMLFEYGHTVGAEDWHPRTTERLRELDEGDFAACTELFQKTVADCSAKNTPEEYNEVIEEKPEEQRSIVQPSCLNDLVNIFPRKKAAEYEDRKAFVDLLKGLLHLEPDTRITPEEALQHPFITMSHLVANPHSGEYLTFAQTIKDCLGASGERVDHSAVLDIGQRLNKEEASTVKRSNEDPLVSSPDPSNEDQGLDSDNDEFGWWCPEEKAAGISDEEEQGPSDIDEDQGLDSYNDNLGFWYSKEKVAGTLDGEQQSPSEEDKISYVNNPPLTRLTYSISHQHHQ